MITILKAKEKNLGAYAAIARFNSDRGTEEPLFLRQKRDNNGNNAITKGF